MPRGFRRYVAVAATALAVTLVTTTSYYRHFSGEHRELTVEKLVSIGTEQMSLPARQQQLGSPQHFGAAGAA